MYLPNVDIRPYSPVYKEQIRQLVMNLEKFYPGIDNWLEKELKNLDDGIDFCLMVVDGKDSVGGVAISGLEAEGVAKLKTFYLSQPLEGYAIGVLLLKKVLNYWMEKRVRRIFVTFAEEELDELRGFFDKFGFLMDGMMPQHYRTGKNEYVMSKTFVYDTIDENNFEDFVRNYLFRLRGMIPASEGSEFLAHEDNRFSKTPRQIYVKIIKDKNPRGKELFDYIDQKTKETKSVYGILVSYHFVEDIADNEKLKIIDGYLLENIFFPMQLKRAGHSAVILPINEPYAEDLLSLDKPQRRLATTRLAITHEKIYYTGKIIDGISRGSAFLFYLTGEGVPGKGGVIGEAKIKLITIRGIKDAIKEFGFAKGVFSTEEELRRLSNKGRITLFLLTHVKKYPNKVSVSDIRDVVPDVDFRCQLITDDELKEIRNLGENNLNSY